MEDQTDQLVANPSISGCDGRNRWMDKHRGDSVPDISSWKISRDQPDLESCVDGNGHGLYRLRLETKEGNASGIGELFGRLHLCIGYGISAIRPCGIENLNCAQESGCVRGGDGRR